MCSSSEAGSYLSLIDSCVTQLKAQGPSRTGDESKEEEKRVCSDLECWRALRRAAGFFCAHHQPCLTQCVNQTVLVSQLPHITVNLLYSLAIVNNKLTILWGS